MAEVSGLSVKVSAAVSQFNAGMSRAQDAAGDLSLSLRRLGMSSDNAERNLDSTGRSATTTAAQMGVLSSATNATNTSFLGLSATTWGSLIPAVVALGAALAPVIGALGGFVAVAGSIAAVGILPAIGAMATNTEQLKTEFMDMVSVLKSEFAPVFDLATAVLSIFIDEFQAIIPELVPGQSVIEELAGAFADLGSTLISALPAFVDLAVTLTQEFLPPFTQWLNDILPEIPGMVQGLVDVMDRMIPRFQEAGATLMEMLPPFTEFGFAVLDVLGPALSGLADTGTRVLEFVDGLSERMQGAVASASLLAPVVTGLVSLLGGPLAAAIVGIGAAFATDFMGIRTTIMNLVPSLEEVQSVGESVAETLMSAWGEIQGFLSPLVDDFTSLTTAIVDTAESVRQDIQPAIDSLMGAFTQSERAIGQYARAIRGALSGFVNFLETTVLPAVRFVFGRVISPVVNRVAKAFSNNLGPVISEVAQTITHFSSVAKTVGSVLRDVWTSIDGVVIPVVDYLVEQIGTALVGGINLVAEGFKFVMNLVQGDFGSALDNVANAIDIVIETFSSLGETFKNALSGALDVVVSTFTDITDWLISNATSLLANAAGTVGAAFLTPFELAFNTLFNLAAEAFTSIVSVINKGLDVLPDQITSRIGFDQLEVPGLEARDTNVGNVFSDRRANIQNRIEVVVEGELPEESIKEVSANRIEAVNRDTRRNQGRGARL